MSKLYLIFLLMICLIYSGKCRLTCEDLIASGKSESDLMDEIGIRMEKMKNELGCIEIFMKKGFFKLTENYLGELQKRNIKFRENLKVAINSINRKMEELHNKFRFEDSEYQIVNPAFMWAQSLTNIYLMIKFGHRHDAPGCLEVKNEEIIINSNIFTFKAYCIQGDIPIKFHLSINMLEEVIGEESTWSSSSVGRLQVTMKKKESPKYWKNLFKNSSEMPINVKFWFEMSKKFSDELQKYIDEHEDEKEREEEEKNRERRKKRRVKKKEKKIEKSVNDQSNDAKYEASEEL